MKKFLNRIALLASAALILCTALVGCARKGTEPTPDGYTPRHTDDDFDGLCDDCGIKVDAELTFLAVNDLHGKFMDGGNQPGVDEFTTYLKDLYADTAREEILLSSGDMWQGTVESSSTKGALMTEWMNKAGFVSMTLGNHEFDWGPDVLTPNSELAKFPILGINVTYNGKMPGYCKPSVVVEKAGAKIGIIGAIGDCLSSISGEFQSGLKFATGSALTALVKAEATRLREEEGCDFIVYSLHDGGSGTKFSSSSGASVKSSDMAWYDGSLSDGYVDLVFEAHTHKQYVVKDEYGVYHLQGGGENKGVSSVDVRIDLTTGKSTVSSPRVLGTSTYAKSSLADDPSVNTLFTKYFPDSDPYETILGNNIERRYDSDIEDTVAKLYLEKGTEVWGSQYDIVLGGGFLKTRSPYDLNAGQLTYADVFSVLPFDNAIVLGSIKGSDLKRRFLESTNDDYHIFTKSGFSADSINSTKTYYIVTDTYTAYYSSNRITEVKRLDNKTYARDLLATFISEGGWAL